MRLGKGRGRAGAAGEGWASPGSPCRHPPAPRPQHPGPISPPSIPVPPSIPPRPPPRGPSRLIDSAPSQWTSVAAGGAGGSRLQEGRERLGLSRRLDRGPSGTGTGSAPRPAPPSRHLPAPHPR
ncbi:unnamed protein product [Coccothraustes coccothraustes]